MNTGNAAFYTSLSFAVYMTTFQTLKSTNAETCYIYATQMSPKASQYNFQHAVDLTLI